jgi:hypothetical protein
MFQSTRQTHDPVAVLRPIGVVRHLQDRDDNIFRLIFEAGASRFTRILMDRTIVVTDGGLGAVAPEEAGRSVGVILVGQGLLGRGQDVHRLGSKIFAGGGIHGVSH